MPKRTASKSAASPPKKGRRSEQPEVLGTMAPEPHRKWPVDQVPVEIFQLICDYLPRASVQCMRLVCREFDRMVSAHYFRNVVAPFRAALYGSSDNHSGALAVGSAGGEELRTPFHVFGEHIRAFALALELNEVDLSFPPEKLTQQVIKTPWGLYRWPLREYQRYSDLEAIEDQADETALLTSSFSKLSQLSELGLSCDAGLGYLQGPDLNKYAPRTLPRVFKSARYEPDVLTGHSLDGTVENGVARRYDQLQRMMVNAGYSTEEIPGAIDYLKTCEGRAFPRKYIEGDGGMPIVSSEVLPRLEDALLDEGSADDESVLDANNANTPIHHTVNPAPPWFDLQRWAAKATKQIKSNPLEPQDLTAAQREMLLEMSWAHDALVQSYVISVTDNYDAFRNVMSFNIARIPAHLVHTLARPTFWDSLPNVWEFSLGVIPDWREVHKRNGMIEDQPLSPVDATGLTYNLLQAIASRRNIKRLHFEWICGGELGVGAGQRNRYVLPAPFVPDPKHMVRWDALVNDATAHRVLWLPHITEMSLKNCWFSPHVFLHIVQSMSASSLTTLKLNTVSITGPLQRAVSVSYLPHNGGADRIPNAWPWPLCMGAAPGRPYTFQENVAPAPNTVQPPMQWANGTQAQATPAVPTPNAAQTTANTHSPSVQAWQGPLRDHWVPVPDFLSWAHILNEITPGQTLREKYYELASDHFDQSEKPFEELRKGLKKLGKNLERTSHRGLHTIDLKSCGYILVDAEHINNHAIIPAGPRNVAMLPSMIEKLRCLDGYMLKSTATLLGKILDDFNEGEQNILRHAFDMTFGWTGVYDPEVEHAAHEDGFLEQGRGRFSGGWAKGKKNCLRLYAHQIAERLQDSHLPTHRELLRLERRLEGTKLRTASVFTTVSSFSRRRRSLSLYRGRYGPSEPQPYDLTIELEPVTVYDGIARDSSGLCEFIKNHFNIHDEFGMPGDTETTPKSYDDRFQSKIPWYWGDKLARLANEDKLIINLADFVLGMAEPVYWDMRPVESEVLQIQMEEAILVAIDNCPGPADILPMGAAADAAYVAAIRCQELGVRANKVVDKTSFPDKAKMEASENMSITISSDDDTSSTLPGGPSGMKVLELALRGMRYSGQH